MNAIRYTEKQCNDQNKINRFLRSGKIGFLGLVDETHPYVVPLNFVWWRECIYFHGADEGRKSKVLGKNPNTCFTVCENYGTIVDPVPAKTDTAFMSVMLFGKAERVSDLDEATGALQQMLDKYVPGYFDRPLAQSHVEKYRSSHDSAAAIYRIRPDSITAKENPVNTENMFYGGRQIGRD